MKRRQFLGATAATVAALSVKGEAVAQNGRKPNFIIVLCDDLGWGDIEPDGGTTIRTPNLKRMAAEGNVLTDYYAPQNICTPSRAGLLTGRYAIRTGLGYSVILPNDDRRLPLSEVTIPAALKPAGYISALFGKWHLGHTGPTWQPTRHGFDQFFGLQYSHDMTPLALYTDNGRDQEPTREDVIEDQLQQRFYAAAEKFITDHADQPFFVELALSAPHLRQNGWKTDRPAVPIRDRRRQKRQQRAILGDLVGDRRRPVASLTLGGLPGSGEQLPHRQPDQARGQGQLHLGRVGVQCGADAGQRRQVAVDRERTERREGPDHQEHNDSNHCRTSAKEKCRKRGGAKYPAGPKVAQKNKKGEYEAPVTPEAVEARQRSFAGGERIAFHFHIDKELGHDTGKRTPKEN